MGTVEAAADAPIDPRKALTSKEREDFNKKIQRIQQKLSPKTPLFLVLGSSAHDIERHLRRASSFYTTNNILHISDEDVDFEVLIKNQQLLWGDFNHYLSSWSLLKKLNGRFSGIYFDWSTFKLFWLMYLTWMQDLLQEGGKIYVPEPELTRNPPLEDRQKVFGENKIKKEDEDSFWQTYKKSYSEKIVVEAFETLGFSVVIRNSDEIQDPIFEEIKNNKNYIGHPPFKVLIATKGPGL
jgi:hypothetical protein